MKIFPRKILYSPKYGAGWSSWESNPKVAQFVAEYKPIVEFIEGGGKFERGEIDNHELIIRLRQDLRLHFGREAADGFYPGGARDLKVATVSAPYRIEEYDGLESIRTTPDRFFY